MSLAPLRWAFFLHPDLSNRLSPLRQPLKHHPLRVLGELKSGLELVVYISAERTARCSHCRGPRGAVGKLPTATVRRALLAQLTTVLASQVLEPPLADIGQRAQGVGGCVAHGGH